MQNTPEILVMLFTFDSEKSHRLHCSSTLKYVKRNKKLSNKVYRHNQIHQSVEPIWKDGKIFQCKPNEDENQADHSKHGAEFQKAFKLTAGTRKIRMCHLKFLKNSYTKF